MKDKSHHLLLESLVTVSTDHPEPLYQQLIHQLRLFIVAGRLHPSSKLPSSRQLAIDLKVSRTTCTNAYQQLLAEGLLVSRQGSGIYVNTTLPVSAHQGIRKTNPKGSLAPVKLATSKPATPTNSGFSSEPDAQNFPFPLWARCLAKAWRKPEPSLLHDAHPGGYAVLRHTLSHYLYITRGLRCDARQIVITAGQRDSLSLISKALMSHGESVYMENPGYPLQRQVIKSLGLNEAFLEVDSQGAQLPAANQQATKLAILSPSRQYPLGISMSGPRKLAWLNYAQTNNCWLLEDDYDSEYTYERRKTDALMSLDQTQKVILLGSFSKLMFQGFRLGYLVLPEPLVDDFLQIQQELGGMASLHIQPALSLFLTDRSFNPHLGRMRRLYRQRRDELCRLINLHLSQWLFVTAPDSGMHLVAYCHQPMDDQSIAMKLKSRGVTAFALSKCYATPYKTTHTTTYATSYVSTAPCGFLLGFSGCDDEQLGENVEIFRQVLLESNDSIQHQLTNNKGNTK
jgi:GntR family transcriptional regulator/MocR family aminotransferase